jgi:hypothetical protein
MEMAAGGLILAIGVALLIGALGFPLLLNGVPGPGFLPLVISIGILGCGARLVVRGMWSPRRGGVSWPPLSGWARVGMMLAAMAASFWLMEPLGFIVVTAAFMAVMVYFLGERSWPVLATVPVLSAVGLYVVFAVWLRVPLPKGIITFLG